MKKPQFLALPALALAVAAPIALAARGHAPTFFSGAPTSSIAPALVDLSAPTGEASVREIRAGAPSTSTSSIQRPRYDLDLKLDWKLLSFRASGDIAVPVRRGDSVREAVFFVFANAGGVGGGDGSHPHIEIDKVSLDGAPLAWKMDGAVLRVALPQSRSDSFSLRMDWHGVVPRLPPSDGISDLMGGAGADISGLLGGALGGDANAGGAAPAGKKMENTDFGLYAFGNGVLSLGAFWYPTLAVREAGRWIDEAPRGLGDVAFAEESDYQVTIQAPPQVLVAAPGVESGAGNSRTWRAARARDFAILASDQFARTTKAVDVGGKSVRVESFATKAHAAKSAQAIDVAAHSLQIFSRRFGPYNRDRFVIVEGPLRGGAGGMEYSGMTAIASALYGDLQKQLGAMTAMAGMAGGEGALSGMLGDLEAEAYGTSSTSPSTSKAPKVQIAQEDPLDGLGSMGGLGMAGDLLKQQGAILGTMFEATIAHEVAHQWWAIGVGSDSQRAPWVDESLTNWSAMLYFEDRYSKARSAQMMDAHLKTAYAMARMLGQKDAPADKRTSDYASNIQYGAMIYGKGALFYDRLRVLMGDAAFFGALQKYYTIFNGRLADGRALQKAFVEVTPNKKGEIEALFARWIRGTHGDEDITGGTPPSIADMLGQAMGGAMGGME